MATMIGAILTFLSLQEESAALDDDRQAQLQTTEVEARLVTADAQVRHELALVSRYRQLNAEADRLEVTAEEVDALQMQDEARLMRTVADASNRVSLAFDWENLKVIGKGAEYDENLRRELILQATEYLTVPRGQPALTASSADRHRARSERYALSVVATIGLVVLLTVARVSPVRLRPWVACIGAAVGVMVIPLLVFTQWGN
ncbi:hypothetical protein ACFYZ4_37265 [Streptomyces sp. NPDC001513]|uniref:hypothetical protein n=1 Tax=Streptomyces sp. NPDC001513 TaxID=3364580 RepID=UPI003698261A